jgi:3-hydroxybutyryl-CoA dehydratase
MTATLTEPGAELTTRGRTITEADLVSFSSLTGDWHPQHCDSEWAAASRFGERVAHGMLVLAYAVGLMPFDPERVVALRGLEGVTFKRPVRVGDTIRVRSRVSDVRPLDQGHQLVSLDWRVVNQRDEVVARARVDALWKVDSPESGNGSVAATAESEASDAEAEGNLVLL